MNHLLEKIGKNHPKNGSNWLHYLSLLIVLFGIVVRLVQYFSNRSLWGDELMLALNIVERSYPEFLKPLDHIQAAPPAFLWVEKLSVQLFGNNEYALRLFPLISGIISLIAFYKLGQWALSPIALPIALLLFACLRYPIYYTTELKQYSSDVMVALLLSLLLISLQGQILGKGRALLLGLIGAVAVWFSHPAIFVLGGIEAANLITAAPEKRKAILLNRWPSYLLWIASFGVLYVLLTSKVAANQVLQQQWGKEYPSSIFDIPWLLDSFGRFFYRPMGFPGITDGIAYFAFVIGCIIFYKINRTKFLILISPTVATLATTYLHKYPFRGRLILFLAPFFILIIAEGIAWLLSQWNRRKIVALLGIVLAVMLLVPSSIRSANLITSPEKKEETRSIFEYIKTHKKPGDLIYSDRLNQFNYYGKMYFGFSDADVVPMFQDFWNPNGFSQQSWEDFKRKANLQSQQRVWFVFTALTLSEEAQVKPRLDQIGQELEYFKQPGSFTYLYQLK
jgi:hypothetical protein